MKRLPFLERFWSKVDKTPGHGPWGDCWLWTAGKTKAGYGLIWDAELDAMVYAHRVAFELAHGRPLAPGLFACHRCDVRACVYEPHLFEGTCQENALDMVGKWRSTRKLDAASLLAIRTSTEPQRALAARFGVSQYCVWAARSGTTWQGVLA